jgi:hypothetical protein
VPGSSHFPGARLQQLDQWIQQDDELPSASTPHTVWPVWSVNTQ